jgi:hypothetical protein
MTPEHFDTILKNAHARSAAAAGDKDGFVVMPEGTSLTLYVAHDGATLSVTRIEAVRVDGELVLARTQKRETYTVVRSDVFAAMTEGVQGQPARRAGFG